MIQYAMNLSGENDDNLFEHLLPDTRFIYEILIENISFSI